MTSINNLVQAGYDRVSLAYREDLLADSNDEFKKYQSLLEMLLPHLSPGDKVLDLGCGCGEPVSRLLSVTQCVLGVDISPVQIGRAKRLVPNAKFICADMCEMPLPNEDFVAIVCLYAIIHIPLCDQPALIAKMYRWLKPGGHLLITVGQHAWVGYEHNWLNVDGCKMYWSHADRATYLRWIEKVGFQFCRERFIPEGNGGHLMLLLQK